MTAQLSAVQCHTLLQLLVVIIEVLRNGGARLDLRAKGGMMAIVLSHNTKSVQHSPTLALVRVHCGTSHNSLGLAWLGSAAVVPYHCLPFFYQGGSTDAAFSQKHVNVTAR